MAYWLSGNHNPVLLVVGSLFFLVPYNVAMYGINDVFDYESDIRNPRKGGIEGALVPPALHAPILWWSAALAAPFVVILVVWGNPLSWLVLAASLFAVVAYSAKGLRFKERPFLDSVTSSFHFVSPALYAFSLNEAPASAALTASMIAFFLWGMASHAFGAVQDVVADREGGLASIATVIGARATVRGAVIMYAVAGIVLLAGPWPLPVVAPAAFLYCAAIVQWWNVTDAESEDANRGWKRFLALNFVAGAIVTMTIIASASGLLPA
ncbi:MAG: prenyltransferase, partial [Actinomycetota bacterium]|jgi:4-hydroxybenzoate polyprenyltransferase